MLTLSIEGAKIVEVPAGPADAANVGDPKAVKLPHPGRWAIDTTATIFLRDRAGVGENIRERGPRVLEVRLEPGASMLYALLLSQDVLIAVDGGGDAIVTFLPVVEETGLVAAPARPTLPLPIAARACP